MTGVTGAGADPAVASDADGQYRAAGGLGDATHNRAARGAPGQWSTPAPSAAGRSRDRRRPADDRRDGRDAVACPHRLDRPARAPAARASAVVPPTGPVAPPNTNPTAPEPTTAAPATSKKPTSAYAELEDRVLALTNAERAREGCGALRRDAKLVQAARAHSKDMAKNKYFSHTGLDKSSPGQRIERAGYHADAGWAENIAFGYASPEAVMEGWMKSPDHRRNILDCGLKALGVGVGRAADGRYYWTQDFGGA
ncbi:CAP domain-containing protein [Luedemannella flava]